MRHHAVISGTGRCGTSYLVELLTHIGLDTGYTPETMHTRYYENARAGLDQNIKNKKAPYIVKDPWFCDYAEEYCNHPNVIIDHIFIPIRDLYGAAESRRFVTNSSQFDEGAKGKQNAIRGGLWRTSSTEPGDQEFVLLNQIYKLMLSASKSMVPVTVLNYPKIVLDGEYLYRKLLPILEDITEIQFLNSHAIVAKPDLVHQFGERDY